MVNKERTMPIRFLAKGSWYAQYLKACEDAKDALAAQDKKRSDRNYVIMILLTLVIAVATGIQGYRILWPAPVPPPLPPPPSIIVVPCLR